MLLSDFLPATTSGTVQQTGGTVEPCAKSCPLWLLLRIQPGFSVLQSCKVGQKDIRIFLLLDSRWQCNMKCQTDLENNKASKDGHVLSNSPDSIHVWEEKVLCEEDLKAAGEKSM